MKHPVKRYQSPACSTRARRRHSAWNQRYCEWSTARPYKKDTASSWPSPPTGSTINPMETVSHASNLDTMHKIAPSAKVDSPRPTKDEVTTAAAAINMVTAIVAAVVPVIDTRLHPTAASTVIAHPTAAHPTAVLTVTAHAAATVAVPTAAIVTEARNHAIVRDPAARTDPDRAATIPTIPTVPAHPTTAQRTDHHRIPIRTATAVTRNSRQHSSRQVTIIVKDRALAAVITARPRRTGGVAYQLSHTFPLTPADTEYTSIPRWNSVPTSTH